MSRRPPHIEISQNLARWICRVGMILLFRIRVHGLKNYPANDGFLICANHQSHLDPAVLGVVCPRPINYLGRQSLFDSKLLGWFLRWNDMIPIDLEGAGIGGLKETLRRLKRGESVLIFPEGTRSHDGELQPLKLGFSAVARRTEASLLPVASAGPFEAMPRTSWIIRFVPIHVVIGPAIHFREYENLSDEALVELLTARIRRCFEEAQRRRGDH